VRPPTSSTLACLWLIPFLSGCAVPSRDVGDRRLPPTLRELAEQIDEVVGEPRIEEVAPNIWVAQGFDLANTILIWTPEGNVVVDASASPNRAAEVRAAFGKIAPGPTRALIYTHSHLDHVGGASAWVDEGTEIWATEAFLEHFFKQYGVFREAEARRGWWQHGKDVPERWLRGTSIGRRLDLAAMLSTGARLPNRTFRGTTIVEFGEIEFHLVEAHGETHDQLFVWIPSRRVLLAGDNYYRAFPNLTTIRGTRPRPIDRWIESLDEMRRREPEVLVPSHTMPIHGASEVAAALRDYRDGIQWVRDEVVRRANRGESIDSMAESIGLPAHLVEVPALREFYGQIDWSVRGIYAGELGWFDGRAETLYSLPASETARREIEAMGGAAAVREAAAEARAAGDLRWAVHLLAKLRDSGLLEGDAVDEVRLDLAAALRVLGLTLANTNGRAYLISYAHDLEFGARPLPSPTIDPEFLEGVPVDLYFSAMPPRLIPERAMDTVESVDFRLVDTGERFVLTVRRGICELVRGEPLPGTPDPIATVVTDTMTWKLLATGLEGAAWAILSGRLRIGGDLGGLMRFLGRFDQRL
jgi:alkyl sulfatase BDS1-like metallo-beta-lactamase superfamily hydrolase